MGGVGGGGALPPKSPVAPSYDTLFAVVALDMFSSPPPDLIVKEYRLFETHALEPEVQVHVSTHAGKIPLLLCNM